MFQGVLLIHRSLCSWLEFTLDFQHSSSADALAMCVPDRCMAPAATKMFPEWNEKQQSTTASSKIRAEPPMSTRLEYTRWASPMAGTGACQLKPKQQWQLCIWSGTFQSNLLLPRNLWAPCCVPKRTVFNSSQQLHPTQSPVHFAPGGMTGQNL